MKKYNLTIILLLLLFITGCDQHQNENGSTKNLWNYSTPEAQGLNKQILDSAFTKAESLDFVDGLLIIRHGFLVAEEYYNGYNKSTPHNVMSVSKSFLSAVTGIAFEQGYLDSLNEKMLDYFPEYIYPGIDPRKYNITIKHLLTMRMGIRAEAENNYAVYQELYNSDNWVKKTIEFPLIDNPGEVMHYNTFQTHLLSAIITKATATSTFEYAQSYLCNPMNIDIDSWEQDPQGYYFGGNSMNFTPQEMAVLGYLYLNHGQLNGRQIVPAAWVDLTLSPSTDWPHPNGWGDFKNYNYAYLWWLAQINNYDLFMAYGYGGQFVTVFPTLDLIVVATSNNEVSPNTANNQELALFNVIAAYVLPSINQK